MTRKKSRRGTALFANIVLGAALAYCLAVLVCAIARKLRWAGGGWHHGMLIYAGARKIPGPHDQVLSAINALGIDRIDFLERIDDYQVDPHMLFAPSPSAHYSAAGYSLLRDVIIERLVKDRSINAFALPKVNKQ
jgi:hypothetical protein